MPQGAAAMPGGVPAKKSDTPLQQKILNGILGISNVPYRYRHRAANQGRAHGRGRRACLCSAPHHVALAMRQLHLMHAVPWPCFTQLVRPHTRDLPP